MGYHVLPVFFNVFDWSTYETRDLRNYWTNVHQIFTAGRLMEVLDFIQSYFAIAQETLPWQPIL